VVDWRSNEGIWFLRCEETWRQVKVVQEEEHETPAPALLSEWRNSNNNNNKAIPSNEGVQVHANEHHGRDSWRYSLLKFVHSPQIQITLFVL
jgi:hypothetical protein